MEDGLRVLAVVVLVAANAFFVIGEYAVVTARRSALTPLAEGGSARARAALRLMDDPIRVISTVQVGITAIGILVGALGEPLARDLLGGAIPSWLGFLLVFAAITYLSVVFGELVPKALTLERAESLVTLIAPGIEAIALVLRPMVALLQGSAALLLKPFGIRQVVAGASIRSPEELRAIVDEAEGAGVIPRAQEQLLDNVFEFADRQTRDILVPASQVVWLEATSTPDVALDRVVESPHERYPVGRGSLDHLEGVVHVRELVRAARSQTATTVGSLTRTAVVVPESKELWALLRDLREQREQIAVVVGEYGTTVGIVTMEDLLEVIVGKIQDEYDPPSRQLERLDEVTVAAPGSMTIDDFNKAAGVGLPRHGPRTLSGMAFAALGRRPEPGEAVEVGEFEFVVVAMDGNRIERMRIAPVRR